MLISHTQTIFDGTATSDGNTRSTPVYTEFSKEAIVFLNITALTGTLDITINIYDTVSEEW